MIEHLPTESEPVDDLFFGRENKLGELIGYLLTDNIEVENDTNCKPVPVIALVGMGGVGKTTLAQHAFNDPKVCKLYSRRGWVCVSDNFHVQRLTRLTLKAFHVMSSDNEFNALQTLLKAVAKEHKFLLVLDDVWNEDVAAWESFYSSLRAGAKGSKIIITTRSKTVAGIAQAMKCIDVSCLSNEDAWSFFQTVVFGDHGNQHELDHPALTDVGRKITERCNGLPLAIKILGRYLKYYNEDLQIWNQVLESKLLRPHMFGEVNQLLGALLLSYLHLPARLKPCFVLASVFPKDKQIRKEELIDLWIAHELVEDCNENTGMLYIQNLVARSFFEIRKDEYEEEYLMIHDIIHDLAMHLSRDKMVHKTDDDGKFFLLISKEVQHAFISSGHVTAVQLKFGSGLRTLHVERERVRLIVDPIPVDLNSLRSLTLYDNEYFLHENLKRMKNLRHLNFQWKSFQMIIHLELDAIGTLYNLRILKINLPSMLTWYTNGISFPVCICNLKRLICLSINGIRDVPDSIGCLTKLCKLHLSGRNIEHLPDTISKLVNLRVLNLTSCWSLIKLPASIGELKALEVLNLEWCSSLIKLPASIGELKALEVLNLKWCKSLIQLPASIGELKALEVLDLNGCASLKGLPVGIKRLTKLQPLREFRVPPRELVVDEEAAGIEELKELVCIRGNFLIEGLENVTQEEAKRSELNNKRHIRRLHLEWSYSPSIEERVAQDEQVLQGLRPHANLEELGIKGWNGRRLASWLGDTPLANLKEIWMMHIPNCKSLTPIHQLPSLKSLRCFHMPSLQYLMPTCSDFSWEITIFPVLERLAFFNCPKLVSLADSMQLLKYLKFEKCVSVRAVPWTMDCLPSLKVLHIAGCVSLNFILFHSLPVLEKLVVSDCGSLRFSESTVFPSSLRSLRIRRCTQPVIWCHAHRHSKLAHLPNVVKWSSGIRFDDEEPSDPNVLNWSSSIRFDGEEPSDDEKWSRGIPFDEKPSADEEPSVDEEPSDEEPRGLGRTTKQFIQGSASSSSSETGKEISDILHDLQSVTRTSAWIKAVLPDAEERAVRGDESVKLWLTNLRRLNYRAADLLGLYEYEVAAQQIRDEETSATASAAAKGKRKPDQVYNSSPLTDPSFRKELALVIRKFQKDFNEINKRKEALLFGIEDGGKPKQRGSDMIEHLPTESEPVDDLFFGRENKLVADEDALGMEDFDKEDGEKTDRRDVGVIERLPSPAETHPVKKYVSAARRRIDSIERLITDTENLLPKRDRVGTTMRDLRILASRPKRFMESYIILEEFGQPLETTSVLRSILEAAALMLGLSCLVGQLVLDEIHQNNVLADKSEADATTERDPVEPTVIPAGVLSQKLNELIRLLARDSGTTANEPHLADDAPDEDDPESEEEGVLVIALVGTTGTAALASLAYSHPVVSNYFGMKCWIKAPEEFNLAALTRDVVDTFLFNQQLEEEKECSFCPALPTEHLDAAQMLLMDVVKEKRFLLVMEGVLNRNYEDWDRFQSPLTRGAPGSKILLTTPDPGVSKVPRDVCTICLSSFEGGAVPSGAAGKMHAPIPLAAVPRYATPGARFLLRLEEWAKEYPELPIDRISETRTPADQPPKTILKLQDEVSQFIETASQFIETASVDLSYLWNLD